MTPGEGPAAQWWPLGLLLWCSFLAVTTLDLGWSALLPQSSPRPGCGAVCRWGIRGRGTGLGLGSRAAYAQMRSLSSASRAAAISSASELLPSSSSSSKLDSPLEALPNSASISFLL